MGTSSLRQAPKISRRITLSVAPAGQRRGQYLAAENNEQRFIPDIGQYAVEVFDDGRFASRPLADRKTVACDLLRNGRRVSHVQVFAREDRESQPFVPEGVTGVVKRGSGVQHPAWRRFAVESLRAEEQPEAVAQSGTAVFGEKFPDACL